MLRGDGVDVDAERIGQIDLQTLAGDKVGLRAGLARHLVDQGDALGFGREQIIIVLRRAGEQLLRAGHGDLGVAEHDECADVQIVRHLADGQIARDARDRHSMCHSLFSLPKPDRFR